MKKTRFTETDICLADQKLSTFMKAYIYYLAQQWPTTGPYFEGGERNPYLGSFCPSHEQKNIPTIYILVLKVFSSLYLFKLKISCFSQRTRT